MAKAKQTLIQRSRRIPASEKATFHTFGTRTMPERDFFGLSERDETWIEQEIGRAVDVNLQREGR